MFRDAPECMYRGDFNVLFTDGPRAIQLKTLKMWSETVD